MMRQVHPSHSMRSYVIVPWIRLVSLASAIHAQCHAPLLSQKTKISAQHHLLMVPAPTLESCAARERKESVPMTGNVIATPSFFFPVMKREMKSFFVRPFVPRCRPRKTTRATLTFVMRVAMVIQLSVMTPHFQLTTRRSVCAASTAPFLAKPLNVLCLLVLRVRSWKELPAHHSLVMATVTRVNFVVLMKEENASQKRNAVVFLLMV
jgi:hypothetical protein